MPLRLGRPSRAARRIDPRPGYRAVAIIERPRGLRGELKAFPLTDFPERLDPAALIYIAGERRSITHTLWHAGRVYLTIEGVNDRETADTLRDLLIEIPDVHRPPAHQGFYYIDEIEGLDVATLDGEPLGQVREVLRTGANDVWIVDRGDQPDLLIPALRDIVRKVDLSARMITVDLPEGLAPNTSSD